MRYLSSAAILAVALSFSPAQAKELIYGSWLGAKSSTNEIAMPVYFDAITKATNGEIAWKLVAGGQLVTGPGTVEGVKNNLVDAGVVMAPYTPKELPATNLIFSTAVLGDDVIAASGAMNEVVMLNCPECLAEYKRNKAVAFAGYSTSPYLLMCRQPVQSVAELQGRKVRSSGGGVSIMQIAGATPVAMNPADATSALERGAIDCVLGSVAWLKNYGYMDSVRGVLTYPMGMGGPPLLMYINRDVWSDMTPAQRKAHVDNAAKLVAVTTIDAQLKIDDEVVVEAKKKGIKFAEGGEDFAKVMAKRGEIQREENAKVARASGVKNPEAILDAFDKAVEKWKGLSKEIGLDPAKFEAVLKREVYDKVDPEKL